MNRPIITALLTLPAALLMALTAPPTTAAGHGPLRVRHGNHKANLEARDETGATPLINACQTDVPTALVLIARGADVNARDRFGTTPLQCAVGQGYESLARALLAHGARVNTLGVDGMSPLMVAAHSFEMGPNSHKCFPRIGALLLAHGARVSERDPNGNTALMWLTGFEYPQSWAGDEAVEFARILLAHGAKVNAANDYGLTPLMRMANARGHARDEGNCIKIARILISHGARLDLVDNRGRTALDIAERNGSYPRIARFLRQATRRLPAPRQRRRIGTLDAARVSFADNASAAIDRNAGQYRKLEKKGALEIDRSGSLTAYLENGKPRKIVVTTHFLDSNTTSQLYYGRGGLVLAAVTSRDYPLNNETGKFNHGKFKEATRVFYFLNDRLVCWRLAGQRRLHRLRNPSFREFEDDILTTSHIGSIAAVSNDY